MSNSLVLLAEDELSLAHIVRESLYERGFQVVLCANGEVALKKYKEMKPDILVLDVMMPIKDGFTVAKEIRQSDKNIPIIFLTAKSQVKDVVEGFELGANDYLKKPFSVEELIIRIQVQLSKNGLLQVETPLLEVYQFGDYVFNPRKNLLNYGNHAKALTSRESEILNLLFIHKQEVLSKSVLLTKLWGSDSFFNARSLDVFITKLRKKLMNDPSVRIINVRGIGYKLVY